MKTILKTPILLFTIFFLWIVSVAVSQNPNGYYNSVNKKKEADLKTGLHNIIKNHTVLSYGSLWQVFRQTDALPNNQVWDMYSNVVRYYSNTSGLNREHSFPVSWWGGSDNVPLYSDINHIFPSDGDANLAKSNYPLGVVSGTLFFDNGVTKVGNAVYSGYSGRVFEPANEYKGDFARAYFYMVTCYQDYYNNWKWTYMLESNSYPTLKPWAINLLLEWHRNDPVSEKEINRNEAVFLIQNNRNPFIDYPEMVEHIWGNKKHLEFEIENLDNTTSLLATPTNNTTLEFGTVVTGYSREMELYVKGNNLKGSNISIILYGGNVNQFSVSATSIPFQQANNGYFLKVKYSPTVVSDLHQTNVVIQGGNILGSVMVYISGRSIDPASVTPPVALSATNISTEGFTANWQPAEGLFFLEVFNNGTIVETYDDIETTFYNVTGLESSKTYSYTVKREISGFMSALSNVIEVKTLTSIDNIRQIKNINFYSQNGKIMFLKNSDKNQLVEIYDIMGRLISKTELLFEETIVKMPFSGIFIIKSNSDFEKIVIK